MRLDSILTWLHVTGNLFWIGGIAAVALILLHSTGDTKSRGELGLHVYLKLAVPAFLIAVLAGSARLIMDTGFFKMPWMHIKLTTALVAIALHHMIGGRAKRMAAGKVDGAGKTATLAMLLGLMAALTAFFAVVRIPGG